MAERVPTGLGKSGRALWRSVLADVDDGWRLDARELEMLRRAAQTADVLAGLEAVVAKDGPMILGSTGQRIVHPAIVEARQQRLAILRLLGALEMTDPHAARKSATPAQAKARKAAEMRWANRGS